MLIHAAMRYCEAENTSELTDSEGGITYSWPRTLEGETVTLICPTRSNILVMRNCSSEGSWQPVSDNGCDSVSEQLNMLKPSFANVRIILRL